MLSKKGESIKTYSTPQVMPQAQTLPPHQHQLKTSCRKGENHYNTMPPIPNPHNEDLFRILSTSFNHDVLSLPNHFFFIQLFHSLILIHCLYD